MTTPEAPETPAPAPIPLLNQFGMKDLKGQVFGWLTVGDLIGRNKAGKYVWKCTCKCGKQIEVRHDYLLHTNSPKTHCGCKNKGPSVLHPLEYGVWSMMLVRCTDPGHVAWHHYGGRGIRVCDAWKDFDTFRRDMGPRPDRTYSIERDNPDGNYEPANCRWMKKHLQGRNRRGTIYLPHPTTGLKVPAAEVAEFLGISYQVMRARYIAKDEWPTFKDSADPSTAPVIDDFDEADEEEDGDAAPT